MSFFGGNTALASSTPAKPGGVFGQQAAGATPSFGTPAFGMNTTSTGFGAAAPATSAAPAFSGFGGFGTTATTSAAALPTLGGFGGFGTATSSAAPSMFGTTTSTAPSAGFGGFGANTATSAAPPAFGFGGATSISSGFGGFGAAATSATTAATGFGGFGTNTGGFSGFGATAFGAKPQATSTVTPGFGGFGGGATNFMLGQPQQQAPQISPDEAFAQSIFNVSIYGDERDTIIAKWNYLQAMWGVGKSFYNQNAAPVEITPENLFCRLKAIGYYRLPGKDNKMGHVALNFKKPLPELLAQRQQILATLNQIFGNKPHLFIGVDSEKELNEKTSQMIIYVDEKSQFAPSETKRILATEVCAYLNQMNIKPQLTNLGIYKVIPLIMPDEDELKAYLENPPKGIDPRMWRQAKIDNPDPAKFIPVPMIGFNDLKQRIKSQEKETEMQSLFLRKLEKDLGELRQKHVATTAKIKERKRQLAELGHKLLKIIVKQECSRKLGLALTPEEEALRTKLENMQAHVSAPNKFKGRLSELLSQMRMQRNQYAHTATSEYALDKDSEDEMKQLLAMQQKAIEVLTETVTKDLKALQIISEGLPKLIQN